MLKTLRSLAKRLGSTRSDPALAAVLALCDRMDADPRNGGVVLTDAVRAAARRATR